MMMRRMRNERNRNYHPLCWRRRRRYPPTGTIGRERRYQDERERKRRKRDFDAPLPSRSASASAKENYYDNNGNDAENECGRRGNDEDADDELRRPTPTSRDASVTETLAIDCEMVGVGEDGTRSVLARVTVVNEHGNVVLDTFVETTEKVTDYRTKVSGRASERFEKTRQNLQTCKRWCRSSSRRKSSSVTD